MPCPKLRLWTGELFLNPPYWMELGIPKKAVPILHELLDDFHRYDFGQLKEDVIGQIIKGLILEEEHHALC